jgi:hypothetical protein
VSANSSATSLPSTTRIEGAGDEAKPGAAVNLTAAQWATCAMTLPPDLPPKLNEKKISGFEAETAKREKPQISATPMEANGSE